MDEKRIAPSDLPDNMKWKDVQDILKKAADTPASVSGEAPITPDQMASQAPLTPEQLAGDSNNAKANQLASNMNFPSLQELTSTFPNAAQKPVALNNPAFYADKAKFEQENKPNLSASRDFISSMLRQARPEMEAQPTEQNEDGSAGTPNEEVPATTKPAPASAVKEAFQTTQTPEQKAVAQTAATVQNPLVDTEMQKAMETAQANRAQNAWKSGLFEMMGGLGSMGGQSISPDSEALKQAIATQNAPMTDLAAKREAYTQFLKNKDDRDKNDPNSAASIAMREVLSQSGIKLPANATYATMEKLAPQIMHHQDMQEKIKDRRLQYAQLQATRDIAAKAKLDAKDVADLDKYSTQITGNLRTPALKAANDRMDGVGQALDFMSKHKDANGNYKLRSSEMTELNMELARILTGSGIVHESTMKSIDPTSGPRGFAKIMEAATGQPVNVSNINEMMNRLEHNLTNQYRQQERNYINSATTMANKNPHKLAALQEYVQNKRAANHIAPPEMDTAAGTASNSGMKKVTLKDGNVITVKASDLSKIDKDDIDKVE